MTTKHKIIAGFLFMMLLLGGLSIMAYTRLGAGSDGFDRYRVESFTAVEANAADALMREGKDQLNLFILTLESSHIDSALKSLSDSASRLEKMHRAEPNAANQAKLQEQIGTLKKMSSAVQEVKDRLIKANNIVEQVLTVTAGKINADLTAVNTDAASSGNITVLADIDEAYTHYANFRISVRIYNANYLPADAEKAYKFLDLFLKAVKRVDSLISTEAGRKAYADLLQSGNEYLNRFKEMDTHIKACNAARKELDTMSSSLVTFFDAYTGEAQKNMDSLGTAVWEGNKSGQSLLLIGSCIGILIGGLFAAWIILGVVRVLGGVSLFAAEIARGNFDAQLKRSEGGEIGNMITSMMAIPATLKAMADEYVSLEQRVESGYLDVQGDASKFSGGFANLVQASNNILKRIGMIFANMPFPVVVLDKDLKGVYLNKVAQDIAGSDYQGKMCQHLFGREDYGSPTCALTTAVRTLRIASSDTVAHPKGKRMDIHYTAVPVINAQGKLASVMQFIVDLTQIKDAERKILDVAAQAHASADRVAAASEQLSAQVEQVSRGADMQRSRVESTATAMNEMNATVLEVARSAGSASEQSEATRAKANSGADLVNQVVKAINGVNAVALGLQDNMKELGQQAESIGGVMNVISDIADQTNLLALNAAIEAARAGEAGRGFAVVADEVRKLAEKTMTATQEVGSNIQAIQNSARTNINDVTSAVRNITEATSLANASGQALSEIVQLASANSSVVASIAAAAEEQSATSEEINRSLEDVSQIVSETAEGMVQASSAVQDLSQTAQQLKAIMERLRT